MTVRGYYDGRVLVLDEPVDLPVGSAVDINITARAGVEGTAGPLEETGGLNGDAGEPSDDFSGRTTFTEDEKERHPLLRLLEIAYKYPRDPNAPSDGAAQHDHYLYGLPKRQ